MIVLEGINQDNVVTIHVHGKLVREDYHAIRLKLGRIFAGHPIVHFFVRLENVSGIEWGAVWEDLKLYVRYRKYYGCVAVAGDQQWQKRIMALTRWIHPWPVRFYPMSRAEEAWDWISHPFGDKQRT